MRMKNYQKMVATAAAQMQGDAVYNGSLDHAAILLAQIFRSANQSVDILSGSLDARVYGTSDVVEAARQFLGRTGNKIRIALENPNMVDVADHPFMDIILDNDDVELKKIDPEISNHLAFHLTIADECMYRFEENKNQPSAVAAFGDNETGEHLQSIFNKVWEKTVTYDLPKLEAV